MVPISPACQISSQSLKYLYIDKLDPEGKTWVLRSGGILDYEPDSKMD